MGPRNQMNKWSPVGLKEVIITDCCTASTAGPPNPPALLPLHQLLGQGRSVGGLWRAVWLALLHAPGLEYLCLAPSIRVELGRAPQTIFLKYDLEGLARREPFVVWCF